jgi:hypothetical protein
VTSEQLEELVVSSDNEYEGARKGINVPVMLNKEINNSVFTKTASTMICLVAENADKKPCII